MGLGINITSIAVFVAVLLSSNGLVGWYAYSNGHANGASERDLAWTAEWERKSTDLALARAKESEENRAKEQQYIKNIAAAVENGKKELNDALANANRDASDAKRMLDQARELATRSSGCTKDASTTARSNSTGASCVLLADLLGRAEARARELGTAYESARAAGVVCAGAYNAQFALSDKR